MTELNGAYWNQHFADNHTPWDLGQASPAICGYLSQLTDKHTRILIPGCGNAHEAGWMLEHGFTDITLVDISAILVKKLQDAYAPLPVRPTVVCSDFFQSSGQFDLIIEQTFFCALDPALRKQYVAHVSGLLKPGGKIAGLLFNRDFPQAGPPFGGSIQEYRQLFSSHLRILTMEPCYNSVQPRAGTECFFIAQKQ
ncbi:MAG: methyltransferase domain-containing protein [Bacteroidota bacterium]|nr:methyltransferase domain-containing protein [Bacteroidota bacterium]